MSTSDELRTRSLSKALRLLFAMALLPLGACVTVRPEQRAVLADPVMQFQGTRARQRSANMSSKTAKDRSVGRACRGGGAVVTDATVASA